jgi:polyisoprenoid-binding protein YceI
VGGALKAIGMLKIAGVEREVAMAIKTQRSDTGLLVKGQLDLLMTDYGITPPKAMLGMLKTDPKVTVTFETVLTVPLT